MERGSTDWIKLKDLKESYPVQVAEYAVANKLVEEPALSGGCPMSYGKETELLPGQVTRAILRTRHKTDL